MTSLALERGLPRADEFVLWDSTVFTDRAVNCADAD